MIAVSHQKRDPEIHRDVRTELAPHQQGGRRSIEITVHRGVVCLTGLVEGDAQKRAIERAVRRIAGVKDLRAYLHVRPPDTGSGNLVSWETIVSCEVQRDRLGRHS